MDMPPEPIEWWTEAAPCPAGASLRDTPAATVCVGSSGPVGPVTRRDGLARVVEQGTYDVHREKHATWTSWTWGPDGVEAWRSILFDHGRRLPWAHASDHPLLGEPFPTLHLVSDTPAETVPTEGLAVVELFAEGCAPCFRAMPHLAEVSRDHGVPVLAMSTDRTEQGWRRAQQRGRIPVPSAWVGLDALEALQTTALGTTFVVHDGRIVGTVGKWAGPHDDRIEQLLTALGQGVSPASLVGSEPDGRPNQD